MKPPALYSVLLLAFSASAIQAADADPTRVLPEGEKPHDARIGKVRTLDDKDFDFHVPATLKEWETRRQALREQVLVAEGLWPMPEKTPLNPMIHDKIDEVKGHNGRFDAIITRDGSRIELDQLFSQQGATPQTKLAEDVGVKLSDNGYIKIDSEQKTNVPGFYAAGDVTRLHAHQVSTAVHEGGTAASAANYYLYPSELKDD